MIGGLENKRDYYTVSKEGNLDFTPNLSNFELAFVGASSTPDQQRAIEIENELKMLNINKENWEVEFYKRWKVWKKLEEDLI